jgi:hypothetical protein
MRRVKWLLPVVLLFSVILQGCGQDADQTSNLPDNSTQLTNEVVQERLLDYFYEQYSDRSANYQLTDLTGDGYDDLIVTDTAVEDDGRTIRCDSIFVYSNGAVKKADESVFSDTRQGGLRIFKKDDKSYLQEIVYQTDKNACQAEMQLFCLEKGEEGYVRCVIENVSQTLPDKDKADYEEFKNTCNEVLASYTLVYDFSQLTDTDSSSPEEMETSELVQEDVLSESPALSEPPQESAEPSIQTVVYTRIGSAYPEIELMELDENGCSFTVVSEDEQ